MTLVERLKRKFISHNDVPITSIRTSKEELYEIEELIEEYKFDYGLLKISLVHESALLKSCEQALAKRDARIDEQADKIKTLENVLRVRNKVIDKYRKGTEKTALFLNSI